MSDAAARVAGTLRAFLGSNPPRRLGIAVSGGGDSMALMHGLAEAADPVRTALFAATVDHGLRAESAAEAQAVQAAARTLGIPHKTLKWQGWDGQGNLQDQARQARYSLLAGWAREAGLEAVALGHTRDDQAETVLMRLARAGGVDGLAAMRPRRRDGGVWFLRPLLDLGREDLRRYLRNRGAVWSEDPSNGDRRYARVRARAALEALAPLGISAAALGTVAANMAAEREALEAYAHQSACALVRSDGGDLCFDPAAFAALPQAAARRLLAVALAWTAPARYPPRQSALAGLMEAIAGGRTATLAGCRLLHHRGEVRIFREFNAVRNITARPGELWDGRWRLCGPSAQGLEVRALGESGLSACAGWRETGRPRASLIASPAVWDGPDLAAAPLADYGSGWRAQRHGGAEGFAATLLSH